MNRFAYTKLVDQTLLMYAYLLHGYITCFSNVLKSFAHEDLDYE